MIDSTIMNQMNFHKSQNFINFVKSTLASTLYIDSNFEYFMYFEEGGYITNFESNVTNFLATFENLNYYFNLLIYFY